MSLMPLLGVPRAAVVNLDETPEDSRIPAVQTDGAVNQAFEFKPDNSFVYVS